VRESLITDGRAVNPMLVDVLLGRWNDILTICSFVLAVGIGYYQIKHYRAQSPNLSIIEISDATHNPASGREGYSDDGGLQ